MRLSIRRRDTSKRDELYATEWAPAQGSGTRSRLFLEGKGYDCIAILLCTLI